MNMVKKILSLYLISFLMLPSAAALAEEPTYDITTIKAGEPAPFDGVLLTHEAAAKIVVEKKFEDAECDLRIGYELTMQEYRYEQMMILKTAENDRLQELVMKRKPGNEPWMVALGFGIGTLTSLGIFALSTEIVQ
jgi:hypothetical protein